MASMPGGRRAALILTPLSIVARVGLVHGLSTSLGEVQRGNGLPEVGEPRFIDLGNGDATAMWGGVDCEPAGRATRVASGGDPIFPHDDGAHGADGFRRLRVLGGDDVFGERCELGENDWPTSPVALYHEGERLPTFVSLRLAPQFRLNRTA